MNQEEVLGIVRTIGPCTVSQIVAYTKDGYISCIDRGAVNQRLNSLERFGLVRRKGFTERGYRAVIWEAVE